MYVPSFALVARAIGLSDGALDSPGTESLKVDREAMKLLLRFVAFAADFDEKTYLKRNPDIATAYEEGKITDLRNHFVESGFFEGRIASDVRFDEEWYLQIYPDVADAVREGVIPSAITHFKHRGELELRSPNEASLPWIQAWAGVLAQACLAET